tara:strand:+ start:1482 stop:2204 length:723 start_codon:yes stop_codon:yes gene_type:complete
MIDSVDTNNFLKTIIQPNIKFLAIVTVVIILISRHLETNVIFMISILLFVFVNYKNINETFKDIKRNEKKKYDKVIEDNHRVKHEVHFSEDLNKYLHKMRKFRKYNPQSYDSAYNYMKMFMYIVHDLEKDDISHPKQYFENAQMYLKKSLNLFQSISLSVPEENYIHALKYNKFESNKLSNRIGELCKKIYKHCYYILYNLSLRFNEDFFEKPDIYKTEINLNADVVEESNTFDHSYELF